MRAPPHQLASDKLLALLRGSSAAQAITEGLHEFLLKVEEECSIDLQCPVQ